RTLIGAVLGAILGAVALGLLPSLATKWKEKSKHEAGNPGIQQDGSHNVGVQYGGTNVTNYYANAAEDRSVVKLNIYVECVKSALPTVVPPEGIVQIYSPMRQASVALVVPMPRVGIPGEKWDWPEEWMKQWMSSCLRCKVTNYGNAAIFDVRL